ncbi:hypothetical protein DL89DRAFT_292966 [Linderina pennispora]|uniref:Core domain-containing protein n=1 Tax=Linderina pennispora TaxID=61395 RepID=A0A1Y1W9V3_9FUNG|nr:uncharacterized protein DL89DRAFT_292966 [Linderina pennispora]ORX70319.1 hypothetical protein DL89DRAFT_292966 [Linderina pennispora]
MAPALKGRRSPLTLELSANSSTQDQNKTLKIGIQGKGCSGNAYTLSWVDQAKKFDEKVTQDGVTVLIDSKALLTLIGTEMDWFEGKLASQFVFNNPNVKAACGCGESFLV